MAEDAGTNGANGAPLLRGASAADIERYWFAQRFGLTFDGRRDLNFIYGHPKVITPEDYRAKYERGGIAKRIVEALPKATWRGGGELIEDEDLDAFTAFEKSWDQLDTRLPVWPVLQELDILVGMGRFGVLVIGADGDSKSELPRAKKGPDDILWLTPYGEESVTIQAFEKDKSNPRFDLPTLYKIKFRTSTGLDEAEFHWTRVIHVADGNKLYGPPRLRAPWNYLDCLEKVVEGVSEATAQRADPGLNLKIDPTIPYDEAEEALLKEQIERRRIGMQRDLTTRGVDVQQLSLSVTSMQSNVDALIGLIAATAEIPQRLLMGSERGQLASTQDDENWNSNVSDRRASHAAPGIVQPLVNRLVEYGYLVTPTDPYRVKWPDIKERSDDQRANIADKYASINQKNPQVVYEADEIRAVTGHVPRDEAFEEGEIEEIEGQKDEEGALDAFEQDLDNEQDRARRVMRRKRKYGWKSLGRTLRAAFSFVDRAPKNEAWRSVHRAADANVKRIEREIESSFAHAKSALDSAALIKALEENDAKMAFEIVHLAILAGEKAAEPRLTRAFERTALAGARAAIGTVPGLRTAATQTDEDEDIDVVPIIVFERVEPSVKQWAATRAASLIVEIGEETREAVRQAINAMFAEALTPRDAARNIRRVIGLNSKAERAVRELERELSEALPGTVVTRAGGKFVVRVPSKGDVEGFLSSRVAAYRSRMLELRAVTIARTEAMSAANEGQRLLWIQARDQGLVSRTAQRVWVVTGDDRLCDICRSIDGETVGLEEPFSLGGPPAHPACRCSQELIEGRK